MALSKYKKHLLFLPLGGSNEIGMNLNLYQLDGQWLIIDYGVGFAEDYLPGVDMLVPDITFLHQIKDNIVGMVITHAHEDHMGAIPYIWDKIKVPIYTTSFTAEMIRAKVRDQNSGVEENLHEITGEDTLQLGPFDLDFIHITHSVPEMNAVVLRTPYGNIVHTGDWKLDPKPVVGETTNEKKLADYGKQGVLAMVCDSTNVFAEGHSGSEGDLYKSIKTLVSEQEQLVIVTTFASNVARMETLLKVAKSTGRKVMLIGRSLWRTLEAAQESGYLLDYVDILEDVEFKNYARDKLMVIATGCQGEVRAAVNKLATETHPVIRLKPNDSVIFASKIIPGNEKSIFRQFNLFAKQGVNVFTEKNYQVHVSGHPNKDELKRMYELVKPKYSIPVHGEPMHIKEHCMLAPGWGATASIRVENGSVISLGPGEPKPLEMVQAGEIAVDGKFFRAPDSAVMKTRRRMRQDGIVVVFVLLKKGKIFHDPAVTAPGLLDPDEDRDILDEMEEEVVIAIQHSQPTKRKSSVKENMANRIRSAIRRVLKRDVGKEPLILVHIDDV